MSPGIPLGKESELLSSVIKIEFSNIRRGRNNGGYDGGGSGDGTVVVVVMVVVVVVRVGTAGFLRFSVRYLCLRRTVR
ncbi:hypothetical protein HZH68_004192 [Vespula germanica]|uniref:Uncharacterized protein n=2 Tax=Vespula TaxID=7451 RepID=A0A834KQ34_VESGE|nr:hypothetical protein HZH68_004192 [Vespula germanica]KAF7431672.1 hypothetical protein H0235_004596 [Vespula pensylvanica]